MSTTQKLVSLFILLTSTLNKSNAFITPPRHSQTLPFRSVHTLSAKKKAKGFGKQVDDSDSTATTTTSNTNTNTNTDPNNAFQLSSIEGAAPTTELNSKLGKPVDIDPNLPTEQRTEQILRQRFGMKSYEEEQGDLVAIQKRKEAKERADKLKKLAAIDDGSFDIFAVLPVELVRFIDTFLKGGLAISTLAFVAAGIGICFEAYANATGNALSPEVDDFIVKVIEPNFTPGLLVLLGFSVSLGLFASAQLGSASSQYQEKP